MKEFLEAINQYPGTSALVAVFIIIIVTTLKEK